MTCRLGGNHDVISALKPEPKFRYQRNIWKHDTAMLVSDCVIWKHDTAVLVSDCVTIYGPITRTQL